MTILMIQIVELKQREAEQKEIQASNDAATNSNDKSAVNGENQDGVDGDKNTKVGNTTRVPETKFEGSEGERLGQLVVTPEVVAIKINNMKENKSPGVDGIAPKILKETVEQICTPLAHVFNMSLQEGIVPLEWKEANIIPLFKKGSRNKSVNYRPVS